MKPLSFLLIAAFMLTASVALAPVPAVDDAFQPGRLVDLDQLAVEDVAEFKLRHLTSVPPYDVVLFGNSRPLPVGADDVGLAHRRFFNASLTGQSLRAHVLLLEALAEAGHLPKVALVAVDNAELQYYGNPTWPGARLRLSQAARDVALGLQGGIGMADTARMALRHLKTEGTLLSGRLNFERVSHGLAVRAGLKPPFQPANGTGFRDDGSRISVRPFPPYQPAPLPAANRNVVPGYLAYDLERLARIQAQGTRVILFENFLNPELTRRWLAEPSPAARDTRTALAEQSRRLGLDFHPSPGVIDDGGLPWTDQDHPPRPVIAAYVRTILGRAGLLP